MAPTVVRIPELPLYAVFQAERVADLGCGPPPLDSNVLFPAAPGNAAAPGSPNMDHVRSCLHTDQEQGQQNLSPQPQQKVPLAVAGAQKSSGDSLKAALAVEGASSSCFSTSSLPAASLAACGQKRKHADGRTESHNKQQNRYQQDRLEGADGSSEGAEDGEPCHQETACYRAREPDGRDRSDEQQVESSVGKLMEALVAATAPATVQRCKQLQEVSNGI